MKSKKLKTLKFRATTAEHDLGIMLRKAQKFLEKGHQVRIVVGYFRGYFRKSSEASSKLKETVEALKDYGTIGAIKQDRAIASVVINPKKK